MTRKASCRKIVWLSGIVAAPFFDSPRNQVQGSIVTYPVKNYRPSDKVSDEVLNGMKVFYLREMKFFVPLRRKDSAGLFRNH